MQSGTSVVDASSKAQLNTKEAPSSQAARKDNIASVPTKNKEHSSKPAVSDPPAVSEKPAGKKKLTLKLKNTYSNKRKRNDTHENPLTSDIRNPNPTFPVDTAAEPPQGPPQKKQAIARAVRPMVIDENYDDEEDQAAEEPVLPAVPFGEDSGSDYASRKKKPKGGKKIAKAPRKSKTASTTRKSSSVGKKGSKSETPAPAPAPTRRSIRLMK